MLLRLDTPASGLAPIGLADATKAGGTNTTNVSVCREFYGHDAQDRMTASEPRLRE